MSLESTPAPTGRMHRTTRRSRSLLVLALALLVSGSWQWATAGGMRHDRSDSDYVALATEPQFAPVALIRPREGGGGSGVLIAREWVITAAHVVELHTASDLVVELGEAQYCVDRKIAHQGADLALLHLADPVENVVPARRYRGGSEVRREAVSVGFGMSGRGDETWKAIVANAPRTVGTKRAGENVIEEIVDGDVLLADFDHPGDARYNSFGSPEPLDLEYFPLVGDSGGGLFSMIGGEWVLIGVTIAGVTGPAATEQDDWQDAISYGWISQWHRVSAFNRWIDSILRAGIR